MIKEILTLDHLLSVAGAYLLGSIPSAVIIGKYFYGIDVREHGSGNAGATNTFRTVGKKAGIIVLLLDILKGFFAVRIGYLYHGLRPDSEEFVSLTLMLGFAAFAGHVFPIFAHFRGGKGVATLFGVLLAVHPEAAALCAALFLVILMFTGYVSLSSMITGFTFPFLMVLVFKNSESSILIFGICIATLLLVTHQKNIERLLKGEESKARIFKGKK